MTVGLTPALRVSCLTSLRWSSVASVTTVPSLPARAVVADVFVRFAACKVGLTPSFAIGPFDALNAVSTARLRDTLRLYLEHAGDARAVGDILNLHPNTVRYRVRQAEQLLGHSVDHRRVYLELALHVVSAFGPG